MADGVISEDNTMQLPDGRQLGWAEYGVADGPVVLAMHGNPGSRLMFRIGGPPAVRLGVRIIAPDRPGFGLSTPHPGRTLDEWLNDFANLVRRTGVERFSLLGISGGGPYATASAAHFGDRVAALGLVSPIGPVAELADRIDMSEVQRRLFLHYPSRRRLMHWSTATVNALFRIAPGAYYDLFLRLLPAVDREVLGDKHVKAQMIADVKESQRQGGDGSRSDLVIFSRPWDVDYSLISARAMLWQGLDDTIVPVDAALELGRMIPSCRIIELAGEGHFWVINAADEVLGRVAQMAGKGTAN
jgi:pimeloyl-ACP methyl ester carboxylesterase